MFFAIKSDWSLSVGSEKSVVTASIPGFWKLEKLRLINYAFSLKKISLGFFFWGDVLGSKLNGDMCFIPWEIRLQATHEVGNSVLLTPVFIPPVDMNIES